MIKNQRGDSLIQLLIVVGIMGVVMTAVMSLLAIQQKETKGLTEKLAANEITRIITSSLGNQTSCSALFAAANLVNPAAMPFDATNVTTTNYTFALNEIPSQGIVAGQKISLVSSSLELLPKNVAPAGIQVVVTSPTTATLQLNFNQTTLVRAIHDLAFPNIPITTTGPLNAKTITGCGSSVASDMRWALIDLGTMSIVKGSGIASVVNSGGPGGTNFRVTFTTPMADANYTVLMTARGPANLSSGQWISEVSAGRSTDSFEFITMNWLSTSPNYGIPNFMNVMVIP